MTKSFTPVAIISGPVGVGKTTVAEELSEVLHEAGTPHTFIDFDQLRYTYPRSVDDHRGNKLALKNLADVWANCSRAGALNLIISNVVETARFVDEIKSAIPDAAPVTFQLAADIKTLQSRVRQREIGSGVTWHVNRAAELAQILARDDVPCDHRLNTDNRSVREIAQEIEQYMSWRLS